MLGFEVLCFHNHQIPCCDAAFSNYLAAKNIKCNQMRRSADDKMRYNAPITIRWASIVKADSGWWWCTYLMHRTFTVIEQARDSFGLHTINSGTKNTNRLIDCVPPLCVHIGASRFLRCIGRNQMQCDKCTTTAKSIDRFIPTNKHQFLHCSVSG